MGEWAGKAVFSFCLEVVCGWQHKHLKLMGGVWETPVAGNSLSPPESVKQVVEEGWTISCWNSNLLSLLSEFHDP